MAIFPCDNKGLCIDPANPFQNFSAEAPDQETFIGFDTGFGPTDFYPPLGSDFFAVGCRSFCVSDVSQKDADQCAARTNVDCLARVWPVATLGTDIFGNPTPLYRRRNTFLNREQSTTVTCPDGIPFTYTVPAGVYEAFSQEDADQAALSDAQENAPLFLICLSDLTVPQACPNVDYAASITASGMSLTDDTVCWTLIGSLPPGLESDLDESDNCETGSRTLNFFGTPTTPGNYTFTILVNDKFGNSMFKSFTIRIEGIMDVNPMPDGNVNTAYSQTLTAIGVTNPIYSLEAGALPPGLSLDSTGVIFGTPTTAGTSMFTLGITEAGTGNTCLVAASLKIKGCVMPVLKFSIALGAGDWTGCAFRSGYASQIPPNNTPLIAVCSDFGGANSLGTVSLKTGHATSFINPADTAVMLAYSKPNDLFIAQTNTNRILRITPEPLAVLSNTAFANCNPSGIKGLASHSVNGLVYLCCNEFLQVYNPATNAIVGTFDTADPGITFQGTVSIDELTNRLFVALQDLSNFPSQGYACVFDISAAAPVLTHQFPIPAVGVDTHADIEEVVFCPTQNRIYVSGTSKPSFQPYYCSMNAATGVTSNVHNTGSGVGNSEKSSYNPSADLIFIPDGSTLIVICPSSDTTIGTIIFVGDEGQGTFESFGNSQCYVDRGAQTLNSYS